MGELGGLQSNSDVCIVVAYVDMDCDKSALATARRRNNDDYRRKHVGRAWRIQVGIDPASVLVRVM